MPRGDDTGRHRATKKREDDSTVNSRHGGRKSQLTPEVHEAIIEGIKAGNYVSTVMNAIGIPYQTYYYWRYKGQMQPVYDEFGNEIGQDYPDNFYGDFVRDLHQAEAFAEMKAVKSLQSHFDKDWRAASEYLSRKFPERWNPKTQIEMAGKDGGPIQVESKREAVYAQLDMIRDSTVEAEEIEPGVYDPEPIGPGTQEPMDSEPMEHEQLALDLEE